MIDAPSRFASLSAEDGDALWPAPSLTLPPHEPLDPERLTAIAAEHAIEILGPPFAV